jgi:hypothetical protein
MSESGQPDGGISHLRHGNLLLHIVGGEGGLEALARKFDPVLRICFLHTSWPEVPLPAVYLHDITSTLYYPRWSVTVPTWGIHGMGDFCVTEMAWRWLVFMVFMRHNFLLKLRTRGRRKCRLSPCFIWWRFIRCFLAYEKLEVVHG